MGFLGFERAAEERAQRSELEIREKSYPNYMAPNAKSAKVEKHYFNM